MQNHSSNAKKPSSPRPQVADIRPPKRQMATPQPSVVELVPPRTPRTRRAAAAPVEVALPIVPLQSEEDRSTPVTPPSPEVGRMTAPTLPWWKVLLSPLVEWESPVKKDATHAKVSPQHEISLAEVVGLSAELEQHITSRSSGEMATLRRQPALREVTRQLARLEAQLSDGEGDVAEVGVAISQIRTTIKDLQKPATVSRGKRLPTKRKSS